MAFEAVLGGEHTDSDGGGGLAECDLGADPGFGLSAGFESEAALDRGGVAGDRGSGQRSAEGAGGKKGGVDDDVGKHFER